MKFSSWYILSKTANRLHFFVFFAIFRKFDNQQKKAKHRMVEDFWHITFDIFNNLKFSNDSENAAFIELLRGFILKVVGDVE